MLDKAPTQTVQGVLDNLNEALAGGDIEAVLGLFQTDCYWRDFVTFTWNLKTMEGQDAIRAMLKARLQDVKPGGFRIPAGEEAVTKDDCVESMIEFETGVARGYGVIRLKEGRIWTLLTEMVELKGHEERSGTRRALGAKHGYGKPSKTWSEIRAEEDAELGYSRQPYVVIIGGGQGGLALAARLRQLDVPTIIVEKNARPGDSWRKRYKSLCLHDPVWYDHMPYIPFPDNWPVFTPKDKMGDWLEMYTKVMELNFWGSTAARKASWDEARKEWTLVVDRDGKEVTLRPRHLVLATGMSGKPNRPKFKGQNIFKGQQQHSSEHPGPEGYAGKKAVVVGGNNSAHDICAALWEAGADVTMVQRSSTHIVRSERVVELGIAPKYSEKATAAGITTHKADVLGAATPLRILHEGNIVLNNKIRQLDAKFYADLEKAGFMLDWGDDDSGIEMKYLRRGSGYYIDVGASDLIIDGSVKLKSNVNVAELKEHSVVLTDGTELPADLVVYATGYGSMNQWAADLISQDVADKVGKVWGIGSSTTKDPGPWEGEQRNMWKPTQQEGLWFQGGNLHQARQYSIYLALQLKARQEGLSTPVYELQKSHHKA